MVSMRPASEPLQLVLLDAGIVAQLGQRDRDNFRAVFTAVVQRQVSSARDTVLLPSQCEVPGTTRAVTVTSLKMTFEIVIVEPRHVTIQTRGTIRIPTLG